MIITQQVKRTETSEQLLKIIEAKGRFMNMINMTAVLDRMEEQQMINTEKIVAFVTNRLKLFQSTFASPTHTDVRGICNIICYLGMKTITKATSKIQTLTKSSKTSIF